MPIHQICSDGGLYTNALGKAERELRACGMERCEDALSLTVQEVTVLTPRGDSSISARVVLAGARQYHSTRPSCSYLSRIAEL